jgi:RecA-family ATPase
MSWNDPGWKQASRDYHREHGVHVVEPAAAPTIASIQWMDMSNWDNEPVPQREWAILNRVPLKQAGLFSGEGGTGKSIIELTRDVAHVAGKEWLGSMPEQGPAFYVGAEDDEKELHIRLAAIAKHHGITFTELNEGGLRVLCLLGQDATLCALNKSGSVETTSLYRQLYEAAGDIKPKNISIDTLSRAFAGNEIDRVQVYAFAMHMQALAMVAGGSVTVLSHPSLAGIASGSGISGSTAWHAAFRFRQYLRAGKPDADEQPDNNLRQLEFKKNQYGPIGETISLRYQGGLFLPIGGASPFEKLAAEQRADDVFMNLLAQFEQQGRNVSDKLTANTYAPTNFCQGKRRKEPEHPKTRLRRLHASPLRGQQAPGRKLSPSLAPILKTGRGLWPIPLGMRTACTAFQGVGWERAARYAVRCCTYAVRMQHAMRYVPQKRLNGCPPSATLESVPQYGTDEL